MLEIFLILLFLVGLSSGIVLLKVAWTKMKSGAGLLGVRLRRFDCPNCGVRTPFARRPNSLRQALWGGWTCSECGTEMDKLGTDISASVQRPKRSFDLKDRSAESESREIERSPLERVFDANESEE